MYKYDRIQKDIDALHAKHLAHPAIILIQPENRKEILVLMVGSPSREWICHVLDDVLMRMAGSAEESKMLQIFNQKPKPKILFADFAKKNGTN